LRSINIEGLPVGYAHGTLIERTKAQALQWAQLSEVGMSQALKSNALADQINLSYLLNELGHSLDDLSGMLADVEIAKGSLYDKRGAWIAQIGSIQSGSLNDLVQSSVAFTMARADEMEKRQR
jgi:hypothetical protein